MFWPTMITDSMTSWMNVWLTHWMMARSPPPERRGRATRARTREDVGAPHRPDDGRERQRDPAVEPDVLVGGLGRPGPSALRDPGVGQVLEARSPRSKPPSAASPSQGDGGIASVGSP